MRHAVPENSEANERTRLLGLHRQAVEQRPPHSFPALRRSSVRSKLSATAFRTPQYLHPPLRRSQLGMDLTSTSISSRGLEEENFLGSWWYGGGINREAEVKRSRPGYNSKNSYRKHQRPGGTRDVAPSSIEVTPQCSHCSMQEAAALRILHRA